MIWGDEIEVAAKNVIAPGDLLERQKRPHVIALADTIKRYGGRPGNSPWVHKVRLGWHLDAGRDRYAALILNGVKRFKVKPILDATREELADLEEIENLYRRPVPDRDKLIAAHVAKVAARVVAERASSGTDVPKPGRPKTPEGEARERVAAAMQTTPAAIKQAVRRAEVREEVAESEAADILPAGQPTAPPPPIETFGHALPDHVRDDVAPVLAALRKIDTLLRQAQAAAKELETTTMLKGDVEFLRVALRDAVSAVRVVTPTHLCPYCRGVLKKGAGCEACNVNGFVTRAVFESAPAELRSEGPDSANLQEAITAPAKTPGEALSRARAEVAHAADCRCLVCARARRDEHRRARRMSVEVEGETLTVDELAARSEGGGDIPF